MTEASVGVSPDDLSPGDPKAFAERVAYCYWSTKATFDSEEWIKETNANEWSCCPLGVLALDSGIRNQVGAYCWAVSEFGSEFVYRFIDGIRRAVRQIPEHEDDPAGTRYAHTCYRYLRSRWNDGKRIALNPGGSRR